MIDRAAAMRSRRLGRWGRGLLMAVAGLGVAQHSVAQAIPVSSDQANQGSASPATPGFPGAVLSFTMDRPASGQHYSVELDQATGKGTYRAGGAAGTSAEGGPGAAAAESRTGGSPISVSDGVLKKVFAAVPLIRTNRCESHRKGIAQTGIKTLQLTQGATATQCSFNFSEEDRVMTAAAAFEGVAETMQYGEQLAAKLRFDRLGLDAEMDHLESALTQGRALEVSNIAPVLVAIQNDDRVMERVRRRAAHLLQSAGLPSAPAATGGSGG